VRPCALPVLARINFANSWQIGNSRQGNRPDLDTGDLTYASAGHLPPLLSYGPGHAEYLDNPAGTMLGVPGAGVIASGRLGLSPGTGLLLYTDGLVEDHSRDITEGLDVLAATMRSTSGLTAEQNCQTVQAAMLDGSPRADDVCILAARFNGWGPSH
jgi:serine phosphatase RsbU (regulator of sigma subunit)